MDKTFRKRMNIVSCVDITLQSYALYLIWIIQFVRVNKTVAVIRQLLIRCNIRERATLSYKGLFLLTP